MLLYLNIKALQRKSMAMESQPTVKKKKTPIKQQRQQKHHRKKKTHP